MDATPIAALHPELPARDSTHFKAAVTLIWPYSSSQRQFALLLAEPDFRLRRKNGQVRARFSGSSARALATTGVGIGDEVLLSLRGARFVQEGTVSTPGRSIDWELEYTQNVSVQVFRHGSEIAHLELVDAAPTPAPRSPRRQSSTAPSPTQQWSSPAYLKRIRLSDGPIFDAPYDPFLDESADGHDRKRRRRSYRDWKAWTYSARTPSPEKGEAGLEDDLESMESSPTRKTQLPRTPVSPQKPGVLLVAAGPLRDEERITPEDRDEDPAVSAVLDGADDRNEAGGKSAHISVADDFVRDDVYYDLYAGPEEVRPADAQYAFGGDTEANTEEDDMEDTDAVSMSSTEVNSDDLTDGYLRDDGEVDLAPSSASALLGAGAGSTTEEGSVVQISDPRRSVESSVDEEGSEALERQEEGPVLIMAPPTLPTLSTDFLPPMIAGTLTPIGKEPKSPTLQPLDSALLPLPSPFPGEADASSASYFDHVSISDQPEQPQEAGDEPPAEADYILENSFFSSINSSKASVFHPDHESVLTPLRFTFGMDNVGFPKPMDLSSPPPQSAKDDVDHGLHHGWRAIDLVEESVIEPSANARLVEEGQVSVLTQAEVSAAVVRPSSRSRDEPDGAASAPDSLESKKAKLSVIELSSDPEQDVDDDQSEEDDEEEQFVADETLAIEHIDRSREASATTADLAENNLHSEDPVLENKAMPPSTARSTAASEIVDLGSPSGSSDVEEDDTALQGPLDHEDQTEKNVPSGDLQSAESAPQISENVFPAHGTSGEGLSGLDGMATAPASLDFLIEVQDAITHVPTQQEMQSMALPDVDSRPEHLQQISTTEIPDTFMEDSLLHNVSSDLMQWEIQDINEHHPDVKMESIEETFTAQYNESGMHQGTQESLGETPQHMLIEVPDEGHKVGEMHTVAVPATGPARNTRSKTKTSAASASPNKEEFSPLKRATRSTRSTARTTTSPPRTRTRSTMSPAHGASQTSPHSLRSQSNLLSPTQSTFVEPTTRRSPRKHASQRSVESIADVRSSQLLDLDPFLSSFQPSQELGGSQGRYSHVTAVKDSEGESLHSEHSISTVRYSDDWNTFTNFSDPMVETEQVANLRPPPASAPEARVARGARARAEVNESQTRASTASSPADVRFSFPSQAALVSPGRKLRSASSMEAFPTSPHVLRSTRRSVRISSSPAAGEVPDEATPKAQDVAYPSLRGEGEVVEVLSSPPASGNVDDAIRSSPPPTLLSSSTKRQTRAQNRNRLVTPELSQQTNMGSQKSVAHAQQQQSALLTPQLTQATSAGLQSFNASMENASTIVVTPTKPSPNVVTRSTPRRNASQSDVASPSTTPTKAHSPDLSSDEVTAVDKPEGPSIGLSTPLAYYTPLSSLTYFLNRSSQFHTSSNPDVLALVTAGTSTPVRATKGRKDWTTSLQITDLSTWPSSTTVNVFRPYQNALPAADAGDVILLRAFAVKSLYRHPTLTSADESSWCTWRYKKPIWGAKRGVFEELKAREEVKGPQVERGEGEWREVERLRVWWIDQVRGEVEGKVKTRSQDKMREGEVGSEGVEGVKTRSRDRMGE